MAIEDRRKSRYDMANQKLITAQLASQLPALYHNEGISIEDIRIYAKLFDPASSWTYFVAEFDGSDLIWGYATFQDGMGEWGYASISEIEGLRNRFGLPMERDLHFRPRPAREIEMIGR